MGFFSITKGDLLWPGVLFLFIGLFLIFQPLKRFDKNTSYRVTSKRGGQVVSEKIETGKALNESSDVERSSFLVAGSASLLLGSVFLSVEFIRHRKGKNPSARIDSSEGVVPEPNIGPIVCFACNREMPPDSPVSNGATVCPWCGSGGFKLGKGEAD